MSEPTVWRLKTKPSSLRPDDRADYISAMLEEGFVGTGWVLDGAPTGVSEAVASLARAYPAADATPRRFVRDTAVGDLVWIVDTVRGRFHLGRVSSGYRYRRNEAPWGDEAAHRFDIEWVGRYLSPENVPGGVKNALRQGNTYCRIHDEAACRYSKLLAGLDVRAASDDFLDLLDDQALEDLVGLYLQHLLKGALVPSSCKKDTAAFEYVVNAWNGDRSCVAQVKSGKRAIEDPLPDEPRERFLFATSGEYPTELHGAQVIERRALLDFADQFANRLPATVTRWMTPSLDRRAA